MERHHLYPAQWLACAGVAALFLIGAALLRPAPCAAQTADEIKAELLKNVNSADYQGADLRPYPVQGGFGVEYYKGDKKVQVEFLNGVVTVRYNGQTATASVQSYGSPSDPAQALLLQGLRDVLGLSGGGGEPQAGSSVSTLNSTFTEAVLTTQEGKKAEEQKKGPSWRGGALASDLEYERFKVSGVSDNAAGLLAGYDARRAKFSAGGRLSYARAISAGLNRYSVAGYLKFPAGEAISYGAVVNVSGGSGGDATTGFSGGPFFAVVRKGEKGTVSFGVLHQFKREGGVTENDLIYGTTFGFYMGKSGTLNVSGMRLSNVKGWSSLSLVGVTYSWLISSNFSLTFGYKTALEVSGLSSHKFTLGMSRSLF